MNKDKLTDRDIIESSSIFDPVYYLRTYPGIEFSDDLLGYWLSTGVKLGHNPNHLFDPEWYVANNKIELAEGQNPLVHYIVNGWRDLNDPSPNFSVEEYLSRNRDVAAAGIEPLTHFLKYGRQESRPYYKSRHTEFFFPILAHTQGMIFSNPEPGIKPLQLPVKRRRNLTERNKKILTYVVSGYKGTSASLKQLKSLKETYAFAKLSLVDRKDDLLGETLAGLGTTAERNEALLAAGITAVHGIDEENIPDYNTPILDRYNQLRLAIADGLTLEPATASTLNGDWKISILMPIYKAPIIFLERAILSVLFQTYANWELILVDDCSNSSEVDSLLGYYEQLDGRIKVIRLTKNGGISTATNAALRQATGDYIALIDHDDMITKDALSTVVTALSGDPSIDWIYTDEAKIDEDDIPDEIYTKPDWSPSLLLNLMYTGHFSVYRRTIVEQVGGFRSRYDFSQDYDLALRVSELDVKVYHSPRCVYGWRMIPGSAAVGGKPTARQSNLAALQSAADRREYPGIAIGLPTGNRIILNRDREQQLVSIIIPSDNFENILSTVQSVITETTYRSYELIVVTNSKLIAKNRKHFERYNIIFVAYDLTYNFSDKCNAGFAASSGAYILLLNDDVRVVTPNWIESLVEAALLPNVGAVAPKLLYESGHIQHAGMVTGVRRLVGTAFHAFPSTSTAHFNLPQSLREVSLLCGACIMIPRTVYQQVNGFDAINTPISHSDVDLCFRIREEGLSCIYTPFATLTHLGHQSRESQDFDAAAKQFKKDTADIFILRRFPHFCSYDPYFPPSIRDMVYIDSQETYALHPGLGEQPIQGRSVLIVSHDLSQSGAPRVAYDLVDTLKELGFFVVVMAPEDGPIRHEITARGAHVIIDPLTLSQHDSVRDFASNFDLVIANTAVSWPVVLQVGKFTDVYWYIHETGLIDDLAKLPGFREAFESAKGVWTGSVLSQKRLEAHGVTSTIMEYGIPDLKEHNGTKKDETDQGRIALSILGSVEPRKGQDLAILGFLKLPERARRRFRFSVGGRVLDEVFSAAINKIASEHAEIEFIGELDFEYYMAQLQRSDVILCTSRDDTLPLVSLHALSAGKILIVSRTTGTSNYIVDGQSGFILEDNTPGEVRAVLEKVLSLGDGLMEVRQEARKVFLTNFSRSAFRERLLNNIEDVTPEHAR